MDVPHHIRSMSNDSRALRRRRLIRHLRASLPQRVAAACHWARWRGTLFLLIILHPSQLPPRPFHTSEPADPGKGPLSPGYREPRSLPLAPGDFHHFQSFWLDRGGASPRRRPTGIRIRYFNACKTFTIRAESGSTGSEAAPGLGSAACDQSQPACR